MALLSIESFPNELLLGVVRHLDGLEPKAYHPAEEERRCKNILALLRCSKRFRRLTEPILYSRYQQKVGYHKSLPRFLRTILARPDLARHVKTFVGCACVGDLDNDDMDVMAAEDRCRIEEAIRRDTMSQISIDDWICCVGLGEVDALIPLLICLLPSLESIVMAAIITAIGPVDHFQHLRAILNRARELQQAGDQEAEFSMSRVRTVTLSGLLVKGVPFWLVWPLLSLPFVEQFSCDHVDGWSRLTNSREPVGSVAPNLASLSLRGSRIPPHELRTLGDLLPKLKSLRYESACFGSTTPLAVFNPREFGEAIAHLSETLEVLCVRRDSRPKARNANAHDVPMKSIGSLSSFKKLTVLEGSACFLIGEARDMRYDHHLIDDFTTGLPSHLEHLTITNCEKSIFDFLSAFLKGDIPSAPTLQSITISFDSWIVDSRALEEQSSSQRYSLEILASKLGINLGWKQVG